MKKSVFCLSLALAGLMAACVDKNEAVDADKKPSWLGGSIYQELKNPEYLTGTFSTYLQLVDDLGYAEVLNRTGSKTVFPANDDAFNRFFQSNDWGVRSYSDLSEAQKKMLLYSSMLDNALLIDMLSNVSNTSSVEGTVTKGMAVKHQTQLSATDSLQLITSAANQNQEEEIDHGMHCRLGLAYAHRLHENRIITRCFTKYYGFSRFSCHAAQGARRGRRTDVSIGMNGERLHTGLVAQDAALGALARRVDGQHRQLLSFVTQMHA